MGMPWDNVAKDIAAIAPTLGTLIGGPAGGAIGTMVSQVLGVNNTPDAVSQAIKTDPEAAVKLRQIEADENLGLASLKNQLDLANVKAASDQVVAVNTTMQTEDKTRSFSWRDYWGYVSGTAFGFVVGAVIYIVGMSMYTNQYGAMDKIPAIVGAFSVLFGIAAGVLGVQSGIETHHSGMVDRINAGKEGTI